MPLVGGIGKRGTRLHRSTIPQHIHGLPFHSLVRHIGFPPEHNAAVMLLHQR